MQGESWMDWKPESSAEEGLLVKAPMSPIVSPG